MWFGTFDGLNRYEGYNFKVYRFKADDSTSISYNFITTIFEDRDKRLWVGTSDGLNLFDREKDNFIRFRDWSDITGYIQTIIEDQAGNLWLGTRGAGVILMDKKSNKFINKYEFPINGNSGLSSNFVYSLFEDSRGNVWIGSWYGHLDLFLRKQNEFVQINYKDNKISEGIIKNIVEDEAGNIWVATQGNGIYKLSLSADAECELENYRNDRNPNSLSSDQILSMITDGNAGLWIGTENNGLNFFSTITKKVMRFRQYETNEKTLNHDSIWSLYIDKDKNLWVGTFAGGINFHSSSSKALSHYKHYPGNQNSLSNNSVSAFWEDRDGRIWIATDGGGLNFFNPEDETFKIYNTQNSNLSSDAVLCLYEDSQDDLWIGTWSGGLNLFDKRKQEFIQFTKEQHGLGSDNVHTIHQDRTGRLWVGTYWGGINYLDKSSNRFVNYASGNSGLVNDQVRVITEDCSGNLWIGCELGLVKFDFDRQIFITFSNDENDHQSLSNNVINSIYEAGDSTLWIGTSNGLNRFDRETQSFTRFNIDDGLPNTFIQAITEDGSGNIWLSTNRGISKYNRVTRTFKNFVSSDGLQGNEFYRNSVFKTRSQNLLFGGVNGFNVIDPESIIENPNIPRIVITDLQIFNRPVVIGSKNSPLKKHIAETNELILSYKHSVFSFEFTALNYTSPEKNQYAYMLEGFERDWNQVGTKRTATYTNISPGRYVFRVKGSNNDGLWNEAGISLDIVIEPPFWKTWWAYLIYLSLVIATIYSIMHYVLARERLKSALNIEHLELEKMHELDQLKSRFFANISHEFRTPITLILGPLQRLISDTIDTANIKQSLQLMYRNAQRLLRMSNQLMDFHKIEAEDLKLELTKADIIQFLKKIVFSFQEHADHHKINLIFNSNVESKRTWFDIDKVDKIIYNLLSNAFKFTNDNGEICVQVEIRKNEKAGSTVRNDDTSNWNFGSEYIDIQVRDNGIGITPDKIEHIFERFYQIAGSSTSQYHGIGIGLALTYELVQLYGGRITVTSEIEKGSIFEVCLSLDKYFLEEYQLIADFDLKGQPDYHNNYLKPVDNLTEEGTEKISEPIVKTKSAMQTLLIVEDDEELLQYIKEAFQRDYRILTAKNGLEGYDKAIELIPDIVISDIMMLRMDGIELCEKLKTNEKTSHIPVVLLTARASDEHRIKGLKIGADAYITKPFNLEVVRSRVVNLLESRKKLREKFSKDLYLNINNVEMTSVDEQFIQRVLKAIEENMSDSEFNADVLSKKVGMSRMQLYRKLRGLTDQTVHEFIRNLRLNKAITLLEKRRLTVTEVAYQVGFNDLTYFARCFRNRFGKLPSEYRSKPHSTTFLS
jgi:signal transduction histidine kinase/ligand-binding sensor domain-containing protein/DNA-binding response OmpR family regulator